MSNLVIILGKSGSGKSTSIKSLNPKETIVMNTLGKILPFKGSMAMYKEGENLFPVVKGCDDFNTKSKMRLDYCSYIMQALDKFNKNDNVKNIIIDDAIYNMRSEFFNRNKETGYGKYNDLADHFRLLISKSLSLKQELNVFLILHTEPVESDGTIITYKSSSVGKLLDKLYDPLENTTITLFAQPQYDDKGKPQYGFYTHNMLIKGIEIPAKTPAGMFEEDFIPNDLQLVVDKMHEYYYGTK